MNGAFQIKNKESDKAYSVLTAARSSKQLQVDFRKINPEIIVNIDLYLVLEGVGGSFKFGFFQMVHIDGFIYGVYNPVFPNACISVQVQLTYIIMTGIAWRNNFNNPVWRAGTSSVCKLIWGTDYGNIRFNDGFPVFPQFDGKWGRIYLTGAALGINIVCDCF